AAGHELVEENADHQQPEKTPPTDGDALHAQQDLPADRREHLDEAVGNESPEKPEQIGATERVHHVFALLRVVKNPDEDAERDENLDGGDDLLFHSPNRSFHLRSDSVISSFVRRGLISKT